MSAPGTTHLNSDFTLPGPARAGAGTRAVTLFGTPVRFDLSCAFATALGTWTFAEAILPLAAPGRSTLAYWTGGAAAALLTMMYGITIWYHAEPPAYARRPATIATRARSARPSARAA